MTARERTPVATEADADAVPRLRIGFVYDALFPYVTGGVERRIHELAARLATRHEVHLVSWSYWGDEPTLVRDGVTHHGVGAPRPLYGRDGKRSIREAAEFGLRSLAVVRSLDVDVLDVAATPYVPLFTTWLGARLAGTPVVVTWHEYWGEHWLEYLPQRPVVARAAWALEATARRLGDQRVAVSELTARRVAGRGPVPVVGNGVDVERIASATPDPVESDVIHLGRLIDEKRVDVLVRAIARVADRSPGVRCLIVGDGPERERLESLVSALGVAASVRFLGAVPDDRIPALLRASRMLALPSQREGYGIVVAEAKAAGIVPIVARGLLTAAPDLVRDEVDGLVFDGSVEALAAAIRRLLQQPRTRERLARAAAGAARDLGWAERAGEMERLYLATARRSRGEASGAAPAAGRQTASRAASPARADAS